MKVLVTGGRSYQDHECVSRVLDAIHEQTRITAIVTGGAQGADWLAGFWARSKGIEVFECPANWVRNGRAAGPIRNQAMLDANPDLALCVAFPGGVGTANMILLSEKRGLAVRRI